MLYFTSDLHLFHENVLTYSKRPMTSLEEMHEIILTNWNNTVSPTDEVYILGDFSFGTPAETEAFAKQLHGKKYLILGNHDLFTEKENWNPNIFQWEKDMATIKYNKQQYVLCHYPLLEWYRCHYGTIHLHGHIHSKGNYNRENLKNHIQRYDVGVDANNYTPVSLDSINEHFHNLSRTPRLREFQEL